MHHRPGIDLAEKSVRGGRVLCHDALGMIRSIPRDVCHCLINIFDYFYTENRSEIFGGPIRLNGVHHNRRRRLSRRRATSHLDACFLQCGHQIRQDASSTPCDEECFHGVAGSIALGLGIQRNPMRFFRIGIHVNVNMADAVEVFQYGDLALCRDALDQTLPAARHHQINVFRHGQQRADRRAIHHGHHLRRLHR